MLPSPDRTQQPHRAGSFRTVCSLRFLAASAGLLFLASAVLALRPRLHAHNPRVLYGVAHLPAAFLYSALIATAVAFYLPLLQRRARSLTTPFAIGSIVAAACLLWLPVVHASRLSADDWFLVMAASIRHSLAVRPWLAWSAVDTVDGNFRPLGTIVYLNHGFSLFGFYAGLLLVTLAATLLFFLAQRFGASRRLALCAALIFVSRDLLYGPVVWLCSLGDQLVIVAGAGCILLLLGSLHATPRRAVLCHLGAFLCLLIALLSKQSAYCIPCLALLTLTLRPGQQRLAATARPWIVAILTTAVYSATTLGVFLHARQLAAHHSTPYPVAFRLEGIGYLLRSVVWFFAPVDLQIIRGFLTAENLLGAALLALLLGLLWRRRSRLGIGPREVVFLLLATFASIALFLFLPSRRVPYYAGFASLWASLVAAALLVGDEQSAAQRSRLALILGLFLLGGLSIQIKRTALIPSGTYLGGTYGMDTEAQQFAATQQALLDAPRATTAIVYDDSPDSIYPAMICLSSTTIRTIYVYRPRTRQWLVNNLNGSMPPDTSDAWTDVAAFHWNHPLPAPPALPPPDAVVTLPAAAR